MDAKLQKIPIVPCVFEAFKLGGDPNDLGLVEVEDVLAVLEQEARYGHQLSALHVQIAQRHPKLETLEITRAFLKRVLKKVCGEVTVDEHEEGNGLQFLALHVKIAQRHEIPETFRSTEM